MTLTKEWLLKTIAELEEERDATPGAVNEDAATALAAMKMALASLEAEPVAMRWRYLPDGIHGMGEWNYRNQAYIDPLNAHHLSRQKELLFTAPPAPVSLPEEVASAIESLKQNLVDCNRYNYCFDAVKRVEDACSAAMLQGAEPVKTGLTLREGIAVIRNSGIAIDAEKIQEERDALNSPAIPDGWVACSERMPETAGNYWGWWSESKRQGSVWFIKSELQAQFQSSEITHWMPLPAAPQQEDIIC